EQLRTLLRALAGEEVPTGEQDDNGESINVRLQPHPALRAMILLAINGGMGNFDCASLPMSAVNLETGWVNYPRPKTGVGRRFPLWPETAAAIQEAIDKRPEPA